MVVVEDGVGVAIYLAEILPGSINIPDAWMATREVDFLHHRGFRCGRLRLGGCFACFPDGLAPAVHSSARRTGLGM